MVFALTELQRLAYQLESERCERDLLHFHLQSLVFAAHYTDCFQVLKHVTTRAMYGAPYHCVTVHMAELYRIVSLRSIVTEASERIFHQLR
jgi:hypothetical protein